MINGAILPQKDSTKVQILRHEDNCGTKEKAVAATGESDAAPQTKLDTVVFSNGDVLVSSNGTKEEDRAHTVFLGKSECNPPSSE